MILFSKFKILGHSMEPILKEGSEVLVSRIPFLFADPKIGDIVVFKKFNKVFIKRIENIEDDKYSLKGDNEKDSLDSKSLGWITKKDIIGKVIYKL